MGFLDTRGRVGRYPDLYITGLQSLRQDAPFATGQRDHLYFALMGGFNRFDYIGRVSTGADCQ